MASTYAPEALIAERMFLAGIRAEVLQVIGRDARVQPLSVGMGTFGLAVSHREVERVGCDERSRARARCVCTLDQR